MNELSQREKERKKKRRKRKTQKFFKNVLIAIGIIVIAIVVFVATIKVSKPDYDLKTLVPQNVYDCIDSIKGKINFDNATQATQQVDATVTTTEPETTEPEMVDYLDFDNFNFESKMQGNYVGNLLGKGKGMVALGGSYVYYVVNGKGICRMLPSTEEYAVVYSTSDKIKYLNIVGDYFYFINKKDNTLNKMKIGSSSPDVIAENAKFVYAYNTDIYYINDDEQLCYINSDTLDTTMLYEAEGTSKLAFVGISLDRVFFTETESGTGNLKFLTVSNTGGVVAEFRQASTNTDIVSPMMEYGFLYYYQLRDDGKYDLCRQKFGSQNTVTLLEKVSTTEYPVVVSNRLFYAEYKNNKYKLKELNMNSMDKKTMLTVSNVKSDYTLGFLHGGEYDFIIGKKSENGDSVYCASCIYTGSTNVMNLKNGKWQY